MKLYIILFFISYVFSISKWPKSKKQKTLEKLQGAYGELQQILDRSPSIFQNFKQNISDLETLISNAEMEKSITQSERRKYQMNQLIKKFQDSIKGTEASIQALKERNEGIRQRQQEIKRRMQELQ